MALQNKNKLRLLGEVKDFNYLYDMKECKKCHETKEPTEFYNSKYTIDGKYPSCKSCSKKAQLPYNRKWMSKGKGIYGAFANQICLYVGESGRLNNRISGHKCAVKHNIGQYYRSKSLYDKLRQHTDIKWEILEETPNHKEREQYWINELKPKYNA